MCMGVSSSSVRQPHARTERTTPTSSIQQHSHKASLPPPHHHHHCLVHHTCCDATVKVITALTNASIHDRQIKATIPKDVRA